MKHPSESCFQHPVFTRRLALQAGTIGLMGLGIHHVNLLRAAANSGGRPRARAVIYIFLSGGLAQLDSFDLKPDAPDGIRGEFKPIATRTPGIRICRAPAAAGPAEPSVVAGPLAGASVQRLTPTAIMMMLTGRTTLPPGFNPSSPRPSRLAVHRRGGRRADPAAQQPAACRRAAGQAGP